MKRHILFVIGLATFLPIASAVAANTTLTEPQTGLTLQAPAGATLTMPSKGIYFLKIKKATAKFMTTRSPLSFNDTVSSFIKLAKIKVSTRSGKNTKTTVKGTLKGKAVQVVFSKSGSFINVATLGGSSAPRRRNGRLEPRAAAPLSAADIAALLKAVNTRQGGATVPLQVKIPTKLFTAQDKTTATVPDLPGWTYTGGGGGILSGGAAGQGVFEFGITTFAFPYGPAPIVSTPKDADQAIFTVWPQYASYYTGAQIQVQAVRIVQGTIGFLAPDYASSAMFEVAFKLNGEDWQGLMTSGTTFAPGLSDGTFLWYHTYIAVPVNGPGGIAPALMNAWASWNHTAADQQRLAEAFQTLLSINGGGGPIDEKVFEQKANAWDEYIRN